eukprot:1423127-Amphidinium_carterae.1
MTRFCFSTVGFFFLRIPAFFDQSVGPALRTKNAFLHTIQWIEEAGTKQPIPNQLYAKSYSRNDHQGQQVSVTPSSDLHARKVYVLTCHDLYPRSNLE